MPFRPLIHIPRGAVRLVLAALLLAVGAFFVATRTEVGRDALRSEIERRFDNQFSGSLRIGSLQGNIVYRFTALDIELRDSTGVIVLTVDSLAARPRWRRIAQGRVELGQLHIHGLNATLARSESGAWNIQQALTGRARVDTAGTDLKGVAVGDLKIVDAKIATTDRGASSNLVRRGILFDYANAKAYVNQARAIVDWRPSDAQIDLIAFDGGLENEDLTVMEAQGQLVLNANTVLANQVALRTAGSQVRLSGSIDNLNRVDNSQPDIDLDLAATPIDYSEVGRLLPRSPLRNSSNLTARVHGPLSALVIEQLEASHRASRIQVEGTLVGLPDSVDFEVSVPRATIRRRDVRSLLTKAALVDRTNVDSVDFSLLARGVVRNLKGSPRGAIDVFLDVSGDAGGVAGRLSASRANTEAVEISTDLFATDMRLDRVIPAVPGVSSISGDISATLRGLDPKDMDAGFEITLGQSAVASRPFDSLRVDGALEDGLLVMEVQALHGRGRSAANIEADFRSEPQSFSFDVRLQSYDLGPLVLNDSLTTDLTGRMIARVSRPDDGLLVSEINIALDSASVTVPGRQHWIDSGRIGLALTRPESEVVAVEVSGDIVEGKVDVRGKLSDVVVHAKEWGRHLTRPVAPSDSLLDDAADSLARTVPPDPVTVNGSLTIKDSAALSALVPKRTPVLTALTTDFAISLTPQKASVRLGLEGDSLLTGAIRTDRFSGSIFASTDLSAGVLESLNVSGSLSTTRFSTGGSGIPDVGLTLSYREGGGQLSLTGGSGERVGPLDVAADLRLFSDRLLITPVRLDVTAGGYAWTIADSAPIEVSRNAVRTELLEVSSVQTDRAASQRISIRGGFSGSVSDRLFIRTESVDLQQFSRVLSLRTSLTGRLGGEFIVSRQNDTPVIEAEAIVLGLGLDQRILGDLTVSSYITPGDAEGILDLKLSPTSVGDVAAKAVANEARITGTFRLPSFDAEGQRTDPGLLDLTAELTRADLFFFEYIFPGTLDEVTGYTAGTVQIGGSLSRPVFDAKLRIEEGRFLVPQFNLAMSITADVEADRYGIRVLRADVVDKSDGTLVLSGDILFNDYKFFSFNLEGFLDEFQIMDVPTSRDLPFYGHIWASGNLTLTGPLSETVLRASNARTTPASEIFIPLVESQAGSDAGFIVFADSTGEVPDLVELTRRRNLLARRPSGERGFTEGMDMELNIDAPPGSTVHLVIDPLLGDVINAVGSGRVQILRNEGEFQTFGSFQVNSGDYLFTAGEVFVRRFAIEEGGVILWDGDPADARLDIPASYRTRASRAGLQATTEGPASLIPVVVNLKITGRVSAPEVSLGLSIDRSSQTISSTSDQEFLETILNNPQLSAEYATSVLLTNSFALTTTGASSGEALGSGAFNSLSQLIAAQLNRYLSTALPNVDFSFGVQGQTSQELDITYGVALRLLDERLVIRGQGVYQGAEASTAESLQGEFVVEVRLSNNVSVEVFYRREGDLLVRTLTSTTGAGLSYRTEFPTWKRFLYRLFGWMLPDPEPASEADGDVAASAYRRTLSTDPSR